MSKKINTNLDMLHNQLEDTRLQQIAGGTKPGSVAGEIFADTTRDQVVEVQRSGGPESLLFEANANPVALTVAATASQGSSERGARQDHRHAMPGLAAPGADGFMPGTDKTKLNASTDAATPSTLVQRDAAGRFKAADPSAASDVVTKSFLESYVSAARPSVTRVATTGNIANLLTGAPNIVDGITLVSGDLVLVKDQTTQSQNGIYAVGTVGTGSNGVWARDTGYDTWAELCAGLLSVEQGTTNADTLWLTTSDRTGGTIGTTPVIYTQLPGPMSTIAGNGLAKSGNVINVVVDGVTLEISADQVRIKDLGVSTAKIANDAVTYQKLQKISAANRVLGSVSAGVDAVELTPAQLRTILGSDLGGAIATVLRAFTVGDGVAVAFVCTHNFNTRNVIVQVFRTATPWDTIETDVERTSVNTVTIRVATALSSNEYTVLISAAV